MKPKFWQTKQFKELEKEWEKKLSDDGFVDAEATPTVAAKKSKNNNRSIHKKTFERIKAHYKSRRQHDIYGRWLKQRSSNCYRGAADVVIENKRRYYELLGLHFHDHQFDDGIEQLVMERRAAGIKIRDISEELERLNGRPKRAHRETIRLIIQKYERLWGIRKR